MNPLDFDLTLGLRGSDGFRKSIPPEALAAVLQLSTSTIRNALRVLLFGPEEPVHNPPNDSRFVPLRNRSRKVIMSDMTCMTCHEHEEIFNSCHDMMGEGSPREGGRIECEPLLVELARSLGPDANLSYLRSLLHDHSTDLLREALRRAMEIPDHQIRRSRGAAFTAIVRILVREEWREDPRTRRPSHDPPPHA